MRLTRILSLLIALSALSLHAPAQKRTTATKQKTTTTAKPKAAAKGKTATTRQKTTARNNSAATANPNKQIQTLRDKQSKLQGNIKQNEKKLKENQAKVKKGLVNLSHLNGQIEVYRRNIHQMQGQLDSLTRRVNRLMAEREELNNQLEEKKRQYRKSMLYLYRNRKTENKLLFVLSADNFSQMARRYRYVKDYAKYQRVQGLNIQQKEEELRLVQEQLQKDKAETNRVLNNQRAENAALQAKQTEQQTQVNALQKQQKELQNVIAANKKEVARLNSQIDYYVQLAIEQERKRREAEERRRKQEEAKRRQGGKQQASATGSGSGSGKADAAATAKTPATPMPAYHANDKEYQLGKNFASNKGRLPMPITGPYAITAHFGSQGMNGIKGVQLDNKGIYLTTKGASNARAIFDGEVSAIFGFDGMQNVLIRHGSYISVYCNLARVSVSKGQRVTTRQSIGSVARDAAGGYTLHFQLRNEKAVLNPEPWLAR